MRLKIFILLVFLVAFALEEGDAKIKIFKGIKGLTSRKPPKTIKIVGKVTRRPVTVIRTTKRIGYVTNGGII